MVDSRPDPAFVIGHSYEAAAGLEAAFVTYKISKLVLSEPPLQDPDRTTAIAKMETLVLAGQREEALATFLREIVRISPREAAA